jgi:hypothetical protein
MLKYERYHIPISKGVPASECQTGGWLVSPAIGCKKNFGSLQKLSSDDGFEALQGS